MGYDNAAKDESVNRGLCGCLRRRTQPGNKLTPVTPVPPEQAQAAEERTVIQVAAVQGVESTNSNTALSPTSSIVAQPYDIATTDRFADSQSNSLNKESKVSSSTEASTAATSNALASLVTQAGSDEEVQAAGEAAKAAAATVVATSWSPARQGQDAVHGQLGPQFGSNIGRKTLVLDLDETLIHSSFRVVPHAHIVITVEIENESHKVFVLKRPGVDDFLIEVAKLYEVVVYTASMSMYANKLLDELDKERVISYRLFRESCTRLPQGYTKDLSRLGRDLQNVIIIDNSPVCYALQPHNAIPIKTWRDDPSDRELVDLIPILESLARVDDIPMVLQQIIWSNDD
eukprot:TRINITY_DN101264_c0_g1_i1.p1 TRINITY_DN101264_c0_g1~~TRINITY_DN101264_c0_g1_i1.p1  ORF type:complete len:345 (-),score=72.06 TRINITY_DN101264_c0_g1_i1:211-1245(-)